MPDTVPDDEGDLLGLLGDEYVRAILAATSGEAMSAKELSEEIDADISTVYRHVDDLVDRGLLAERTRIVDDGSHHSIYEANVDHVGIDIADGKLDVDVEIRESAAERFSRIWDDIREA